jgi:hypothetical protein
MKQPEVRFALAHDWKPTTNTLAVWRCTQCHATVFDPHPLPKGPCEPSGLDEFHPDTTHNPSGDAA